MIGLVITSPINLIIKINFFWVKRSCLSYLLTLLDPELFVDRSIYGVMDKVVDQEVNKVVDEDEANAVDKKLNESSVLQDAVMVMVIVVEAIMKLTLVMQMMVDKEVDVKLDWEVDEEVGVEVD